MHEEPQPVFPSRIAKRANFCNRVEEKKRIRNNIKNIQHTLIISPRRYGKTSLVFETLHQASLPFGYVHFFNAFRDEIVLKRFVEGLCQLLTHLLPRAKSAWTKFSDMIHHAKLSVNVVAIKAEVSLHPIFKDVTDTIKGLLEDIDRILKDSNKQAVIFFDEFQDIVESDSSDELQAILREHAQFTENLTFIISGSHRHMLLKIFDDSSKPFYKLFDRIDLHRIQQEDYIPFVQKLALKKWDEQLPNTILDEIFSLTECHAYYINRLCSKVWTLDNLPTFQDIQRMWSQLVEEEFGAIANDLSALTKNQRVVLQNICKQGIVAQPNADHFIQLTGLSARSIALAIEALERTDHVEKTLEGYRTIDPIAKFILSK